MDFVEITQIVQIIETKSKTNSGSQTNSGKRKSNKSEMVPIEQFLIM
jgi:hypothetical protein